MKRCFLLFLMLFFLHSVYAVMLSPPSYDIEFSPNLVQDCSFAVKNTASLPMDFSIYVEGDLNSSIKISEYDARIAPNEWHNFLCTLSLPKDITPGLHLNSVVVIEGKRKESMVGAVAGVRILLNIRKPYPGKYLEGDLQIPDSHINKPVVFNLLLTSRGSQTIDSAKALFYVYSPSGELIETVLTESITIKPSAVVELTGSWVSDKAGVYHLVADVSYDGNSLKVERNFRVGDLFIEVVKVSAPESKLGGVAKVFVDVQSFWNERIDNVYASLSVKDFDNVVASSESPSISLEPWQSKTLTLYFDTANLKPSTYDLVVSLRYADKESKGTGSIKLVKPFPITVVLVIVIVILLLLTLYLLKFRRRKGKRKRK